MLRCSMVTIGGSNRDQKKKKLLIMCLKGLANPAPIFPTFYAEDQVFNDVKLDGVVTLVDAKHAGFHLDEVKPEGVVNEAVEQIAYADRIIVNKTDLFGGEDVASLVQRIRGVHDIFQGSPDRPWLPDEPRVNKIVFIGKNLDAWKLEKGFKGCLV
ncbi:hypothetical protein ACH5RR_008230 [Cinchona calisaya]|uniref:CobW/HypB/UreG nucleotide-binding domain-containing protein n=1 Tax=Cinchona calisaya TaxID=153742 RepID=A0ABD3ACN3_9GENT